MLADLTQTHSDNGQHPPATVPTPQHAAEIERLHAISVEIASLQELPHVMDRALDYCLELTASEFGFVGLMQGSDQMDVAAIKGFVPDDPSFYAGLRSIPVRPSVFGVVVLSGQPHLSNDVAHDPLHVGTPRGHPPVRTFLGAPLVFGTDVLGMLGVANRQGGYDRQQEQLLSVFANQVAVAIRNARLYEEQRSMIGRLQRLRGLLDASERERLLDDERQRIARELHDRVAQTFSASGSRRSRRSTWSVCKQQTRIGSGPCWSRSADCRPGQSAHARGNLRPEPRRRAGPRPGADPVDGSARLPRTHRPGSRPGAGR